MRNAKLAKSLSATYVSLIIASLVFAFGVVFAGAPTAFAQEGEPGSANTPDDSEAHAIEASGIMAAQDAGDQNYAVFDSDTSTLTFYFGPKPEASATQTIYEGYDTAAAPYECDGDRPWYPKKTNIKHVVFDSTVAGHLKPKNTAWWFAQFYSLEDVAGLENLDASDVTSMAHMFDSCSGKLTTLDFSVLDTSHVTNMDSLLSSCGKAQRHNALEAGSLTASNLLFPQSPPDNSLFMLYNIKAG